MAGRKTARSYSVKVKTPLFTAAGAGEGVLLMKVNERLLSEFYDRVPFHKLRYEREFDVYASGFWEGVKFGRKHERENQWKNLEDIEKDLKKEASLINEYSTN